MFYRNKITHIAVLALTTMMIMMIGSILPRASSMLTTTMSWGTTATTTTMIASRSSSLPYAAAFVHTPIVGSTRVSMHRHNGRLPRRRNFSFLLQANGQWGSSSSRSRSSSTNNNNNDRKENISSFRDVQSKQTGIGSNKDNVLKNVGNKTNTIVPSRSPIRNNSRPPVQSVLRRNFTSTGPTPPPSQPISPWVVPKTIDIPEGGVDITFVRSSGAGGQNVNKVSTKVEVRLHVPTSGGWIPSEVIHRLLDQQANRISKEGILTVTSQEYRTQGQNKKDALDKLKVLILEAWPRPKIRKQRTGVSVRTKERNKELKRQRSATKQNRKRVDDW